MQHKYKLIKVYFVRYALMRNEYRDTDDGQIDYF